MLLWQRHGEGPNVVLVHGFLGSSKIFEPLTEHLLQRYSVTTIDLPGFGRSCDIPVPHSVEALGELVATTIRAAGLTRCSILGHSLGAWIALEISLQQPSLLDKMILYGGSPDGYCPDRFESYEKSIERIRSQGVEAFAADLAAQWFQRGREDPMYPLARESGRGANESSAIEHVKSWNHWKRRDRLDQVITPTLVVCGDSDRSTHPDLSIEMWKKIPRSQLYIAPDAGHIVHLEQTEAFNWTVAKFLQLKFQ